LPATDISDVPVPSKQTRERDQRNGGNSDFLVPE
jgi:hypothetical protein